MTRAEIEIQQRDKARITQAQQATHWHDCARFCCPEKSSVARNLAYTAVSSYRPNPQRHNDTAIDGLRVFSGGVKSWMCPGPEQGWFSFAPHANLEAGHALKDWLAECTQRADQAMHRGGFYHAAHQVVQDLGVFGTAGMFIDQTEAGMNCRALSPAEFVFTRTFDQRGMDRMMITYHRTAKQLADEFGRGHVPEQVRQAVDGNRGEESNEVLHSIYRRPENEIKQGYPEDPAGMPVGSCWIHVASKKIMREGGFEEFPAVVPRWRTVSGTDGLYGVAPAMDALATARGVNLLEMLMATQIEVGLNPRLLVPPGTGAIDLTPGGITPIPDSGMKPEAWLDRTGAGYGIEASFLDRKERTILRAFHADLFEKVSPIAEKREITNYVAQAMEREAIGRIHPAMGSLEQEFLEPALLRVFMICYRAGLFSAAPDEAFWQDQGGQRYFVFPRVAHTSRMAQALNSKHRVAFANIMERALAVAQFQPDVLDAVNWEVPLRELAREDGAPQEWLRSLEEIQAIRSARASAQQAEKIAEMAGQALAKNPELLTGGKAA